MNTFQMRWPLRRDVGVLPRYQSRTMKRAVAVWVLVVVVCGCHWPGAEDPSASGNGSTSSSSSGVAGSSGAPGSSAGSGASAGSSNAGSSGVVLDGGVEEPGVDAGVTVPNAGWIGGACSSVADCTYANPLCLTPGQGFPGGTCSQDCALYCPDQDGPNAVTFCVDPPAGVTAAGGLCVSRCDYGLYPGTGCRTGYGCREVPRHDEPATRRYACLPGAPSPVSSCYQELTMAGVPYEPTTHADTSPAGQPNLVCHIDDPVRVTGPIRGIPFRYTSNATATPMLMSCALALALDRLAAILVETNVSEVEHLGVYNCRVISGTASLSEHGLGTAIDLAAFRFPDGRRWSVLDDFEEGTTPATAAGQWMWDLVNRMYDDRVFNIILTPNYNAAHRNHFHVDLTSGAHYLRAVRWDGTRFTDEEDAPLFLTLPNLQGD